MRNYSKYLESLRIKPDHEKLIRDRLPDCEWPGCSSPARHPAPKGRDREGEYYYFCTDHARQYNKNYNYFSGMADEELREWLERNLTGHRPTWKFAANAPGAGAGAGGGARAGGNPFRHGRPWIDPFELFGRENHAPREPKRRLPRTIVSALDVLGLDESASREQIKARYKSLVKKLHPDANQGSRAMEARLREVIKAYNRLRKANMV